MVLVWLGLIVATVFLVKSLLGGKEPRNADSSPLEVLKTRYASGEISREEFETKKKDITSR